MKKILVLVLGISCSLISMEPFGGHKEKDRQSSSSGTSGSKASQSQFDDIDLEKGKEVATRSRRGTIIFSSEEELHRELKARGIELDNMPSGHISMVYIPKVNMDKIERDITPQPVDQDFQDMVNFFKEHYKQTSGVDLSAIDRRLVEKFKQVHDTPPNSPFDGKDDGTLDKAQKAIQVLRKATIHQTTLRTQRQEEEVKTRHTAASKKSPIARSTREAKPLEIINTVAQNPAVHEEIRVLQDMATKLLSEKLTETQDSKTKTTWAGVVGTLGSAVITGVVTYLSTKKSC